MKSQARTTVSALSRDVRSFRRTVNPSGPNLGTSVTEGPSDTAAERNGRIPETGVWNDARETANIALCREDGHVRGRRGKILLVEDEEMLLSAVSRMLGKQGYSVLEALDGAAAVELLRLHGDSVALMLLDVSLPGVSSREVLQEARSIRPGIAVILTSAFSQNQADNSFGGLQVEHFIRKPYRLAALVGLLQHVLSAE